MADGRAFDPLGESGLAACNAFTSAPDLSEAVEKFVALVVSCDDFHRERFVADAVDHLKVAKILGGPKILRNAVRVALRRARRQMEAVPAAAIDDPLPDGTVIDADLANAHRVVRDHGEDLRYCEELGGWLAWNGASWTRDESEAVRRAMEVASALLRLAVERHEAALTSEDRALADRYLAHARKSQSEPSVRRALALAHHLEPTPCDANAFDRDPDLINFANGTLDLKTFELRAHRREDMLTRTLRIAFDPRAAAPMWERFLGEILPDEEIRAFVQRFCGYCLTGHTTEQCLIVLWGDGSNGKSTLVEALRHAFGPYALEAAGETFLVSRKGRSTDNKLADLRGVRLVTSSESGEGGRLDETLVKRATGGDELTANHLYAPTFRFHPNFKLWMSTNHKPEIVGQDLGIWRRLRLVPFTVTIAPERRDLDLGAKLDAEAAGILAWAVEGCRQWRVAGLNPPDAVLAATADWRAEANDVAAFVVDRCVWGDFAKVKAGALYAAYREWAASQGCEPVSAKAFGQRVAGLGYRSDRTNAEGRIWRGLGLRADGEHDA